MNNRTNPKPQSHLINILKTTAAHHPNFVLFLGAGASKTSGVKIASDMIKEWRECIHAMYAPGEDCGEYLAKQSWYGVTDEYSILFETLYDQPSQRREYIESCLSTASPSWGYIYLVNLLQERVFNAVLTTNFDDLLNEACYQFSDSVRPLVCAHDSSIWSVRITSKRPKIIKLHGDFLFDNIKNTVNELESLEGNMKEKVRQYAGEYGLIVVGYSGSDRSMMDTLNALLRNDLNFPHGVYWCIRKNEKPNSNVELLQRFPKFHLIEIDDFDNFFADIHASLKLDLQPEMSDPYNSLAKRLNNLITSAKIPKPLPNAKPSVIQRDIEMIGQKITDFSRLTSNVSSTNSELDEMQQKPGSGPGSIPLPFIMLADIEERRGNTKKAMDLLVRQLTERPSATVFAKAFNLLSRKELAPYAEHVVTLLQGAKDVLLPYPGKATDFALTLIHAGLFSEADRMLDLAKELWQRPETLPDAPTNFTVYILNKMQIKIHMKRNLDEQDIFTLNNIANDDDLLNSMGANILLGNYSLAQQQMLDALNANKLKVSDYERWPIFRLLDDHLDNPELQRQLSRFPEIGQNHLGSLDEAAAVHISGDNSDNPDDGER